MISSYRDSEGAESHDLEIPRYCDHGHPVRRGPVNSIVRDMAISGFWDFVSRFLWIPGFLGFGISIFRGRACPWIQDPEILRARRVATSRSPGFAISRHRPPRPLDVEISRFIVSGFAIPCFWISRLLDVGVSMIRDFVFWMPRGDPKFRESANSRFEFATLVILNLRCSDISRFLDIEISRLRDATALLCSDLAISGFRSSRFRDYGASSPCGFGISRFRDFEISGTLVRMTSWRRDIGTSMPRAPVAGITRSRRPIGAWVRDPEIMAHRAIGVLISQDLAILRFRDYRGLDHPPPHPRT